MLEVWWPNTTGLRRKGIKEERITSDIPATGPYSV